MNMPMTEFDDDGSGVEVNDGLPPITVLPAYLFLDDEEMRNEARRCFALSYMLDGSGMLKSTWRQDLGAVHRFLREGTVDDTSNVTTFRNVNIVPQERSGC